MQTSGALSPTAALTRLLEGNKRFVAGKGAAYTGFRAELADGQSPFAVFLGCSDSRVPAELVFDVGLGDLFVIRVAGNIVAPSLMGSVEFSVSQFGTPLVVVMGHTRCGAIGATLRTLEGAQPDSRSLEAITNRIAPHIREAAATHQAEQRVTACVEANVRASVKGLYESRILYDSVREGRLAIVGAVYAVETGAVTVLP
jgi:carbonic anhydrase